MPQNFKCQIIIFYGKKEKEGISFRRVYLILNFYCCCNKLPQIQKHTAIHIYYLNVLQVRSLTQVSWGQNPGVIRLHFLPDSLKMSLFPCWFEPQKRTALLGSWPFPLSAKPASRMSLSHIVSLWLCSTTSCLSPNLLFSQPPSLRTLWFYWAHTGNPGSSHLISDLNSPLSSNVTYSQVPGIRVGTSLEAIILPPT